MTTYIIDILNQLNNDSYRLGEEVVGDRWESGKTVKHEAMVEVQKLSDESLLPALIKEFKADPKSSNAHNILFLISSIVSNSLNNSGMDFMYDLLVNKKNSSFLSHCLGFYSSRAQLPTEYSIKPFIELFKNRSKWIRIASYEAVANSLHDERESILLSRLAILVEPYEIERLLSFLSRFCGAMSLAEVEKHAKSKSARVRAAAKMCIASMNVRNGETIESQRNKMPPCVHLIIQDKRL
jgi:hypothetical protein